MKHQKQLSNLNLEFSFCSDATKHQDDKENAKPPTRQPAHFSSVNIFTIAKSADEEETKKSPQKQQEEGSLFKLNIPPISPRKPFELESATEVLRFPHSQEVTTRHTSSQNRYQQVDEAASLCESREEVVQVGDFTYKEKEAMETMIQQLEKELFKEQQQYDSRPQV